MHPLPAQHGEPRKRDLQEQQQIIPPPRSAIPELGPGNFSTPGSFTPLSQSAASGDWILDYSRTLLPPPTVPSEPHHMSHSAYGHHPLSPSEDSPTSPSYNHPSRAELLMHHNYSYQDTSGSQWFPSNRNLSTSHNSSLSSFLNPSSNGSNAYNQNTRPMPTINTAVHSGSSYSSPFSSIPLHSSEQCHLVSLLSPKEHFCS
ncbi:hypothetical protein EV359DRAFT_82235 [Lentinula novae-zelandiae]|nr:hypothetical protein EV359DRAFT_82235 [Lentinula novae-zelandiae]